MAADSTGLTALERLAARNAAAAAAAPLARPAAPLPRPAVPRAAPHPSPADADIAVDDAAYERFAVGIRPLLGFDLTQYKRPQVWRRANAFARQRGCATLDELVSRCRTDADLRTATRDMITINVSEFFRNPEAWESLRTRVVPELLALARPVRMWSAGCSLGYEPYTFAMLLREASPAAQPRILATDLDETILAQARAGAYTEHQMIGVSPARRSRFFEPRDGRLAVKAELRALVEWRRHDLLRDAFPPDQDLIACRNVVIYFTEEAKDGLYRRFVRSMRVGGVLFIGATEAIPSPRSIGLEPLAPGLYRRVE